MPIQHEGTLSGVDRDAALRAELQRLAVSVAQRVCDVRGVVTRAEADRLDTLREMLGLDYDAVNARWILL